MNRINPLYLGLFLIILLMFVFMKLSNAKSELAETKEAYKESLKLSTELSGLKKVYSGVNKLPPFRSASLVQKATKTGVTISSENMNIQELNSIMSKLLNGAYNITTFEIKKLSATTVSLHLEIKW